VKQRLALLHVLLFFCIVLLRAGICRAEDTVIVLSAEIRPYMEAMEGLRSELGGTIAVFSLNTNPELVKRQLQEEPHRVVVAVGPEAAELLYKTPVKTANPVVLMVLDPEKFLGQSSLCGVDLRVPFSEQFRILAEKMGKGLRVGIPFNPQENQAWIDEARIHAQAQGCTLFPIPVRSREEVAAQLTAAYGSIDVLLFIPDPVVITESLVSHLIKDAMKRGVPSVGFNSFFMRAGAVLSFNLDYKKTGILTAGIIKDGQAGSDCRLLPPPFEIGWSEKAWQLILSFREGSPR
jgi:putative tryptophan/tyrosine transport system substrate-binding protein